MAITINVKTTGFEEFARYLKGMVERMKNARPALLDCARWAQKEIKGYFNGETGAINRAKDGIYWPDKSPVWQELEKGDGPTSTRGRWPLYYTGKLMSSIGFAATKDTFTYGTNKEYAQIHNEGSKGQKIVIPLWIRQVKQYGAQRISKSGAGTLMGYRITTPDAPGAFPIGIRQRIYKREFIKEPTKRFVDKWMAILQDSFLKEKT